MILCTSLLSSCHSPANQHCFARDRDPRARICTAVACLSPHHHDAPASQASRRGTILDVAHRRREALVFSRRYVVGPYPKSRDNNPGYGIMHHGNCQSPTTCSFSHPPISAPKVTKAGGWLLQQACKARQLHGSTSRDETQSQAPIARKLLDWKANTPTFSASPSLPLCATPVAQPQLPPALRSPASPTTASPSPLQLAASQASLQPSTLALTTIAASFSLSHNHPAGLPLRYPSTATQQV